MGERRDIPLKGFYFTFTGPRGVCTSRTGEKPPPKAGETLDSVQVLAPPRLLSPALTTELAPGRRDVAESPQQGRILTRFAHP